MREIYIRRADISDAESVKSIYECPSVYSATLQIPFPSLETWKKRCSDAPQGYYSFVAEVDGQVVGQLGLETYQNPRRKHVSGIGMGVKDSHQGQGIGSKLLSTAIELAESWLNISRIELSVYTDNEAAIHLYKKHGFFIEGESAHFAYRNGKYASVYHMAKIRTT
ncbi:GNAT family N-acetyltransferase [Chitinibacteraceae bacterium HSL-7]